MKKKVLLFAVICFTIICGCDNQKQIVDTSDKKEESTTVYYEFGDPTTESTTDYTTLTYPTAGTQAKVFVKLDPTDNQKSVCIVKNNELACFEINNYATESEHVKQVFGESSCTSSGSIVTCDDDNFDCLVNSYGYVDCYDGATSRCYVYADGYAKCHE